MSYFLTRTILCKFGPKYLKKSQIMKNLAVFDFDYTVINDNSDTAVTKLVDPNQITPQLKALHKNDGWTAYMQGVFNVLHRNNVTETDIASYIENLPEVPGMKGLIRELHDNMNYDIILISDSNTYFINAWLKANGLTTKILKVFSNPGHFNEDGLLIIKMYHLQDYCKLSTKNMCKGSIMDDFIKEQSKRDILYRRIIYVGDGYNDFCPILRLNKNAVACCREAFKCVSLVRNAKKGINIEANDPTEYVVAAQLCAWKTGDDILDFLKQQ